MGPAHASIPHVATRIPAWTLALVARYLATLGRLILRLLSYLIMITIRLICILLMKFQPHDILFQAIKAKTLKANNLMYLSFPAKAGMIESNQFYL